MNTNRMTMKEARNNTGMTVSTACAAMQISREKLLSWESGRSLPAADEAIRMAAVYGLKLNDIDFSRTDSKQKTFDTSALRARILEQYGTIKTAAKAFRMVPASLAGKLDNQQDFFRDEIVNIRIAMQLNDNEVRNYFFQENDSSRTKMEITLANKFLEMTEKEQTTLLAIMEMVSGNQARREFAERWTGKMEDLPAALAQI